MPIGFFEIGIGGKHALGLELISPDLEAGETISAVETTITPAVGLTKVGSPSKDDTHVYQIVEGVTVGEYEIQFKITTSAGYVHNHPELNVLKVKVVA